MSSDARVGRRSRPLLIVHTGDGKGKTTAAWGLALRGWAEGWSIGVFQFVKTGTWPAGERTALLALADVHRDRPEVGGRIEVHTLGTGWSWARKQATPEEEKELAGRAWQLVAAQLAEQRHTLYVLDELTYPLRWGWLDVEEVVATLGGRPGIQHVVVTGRECPEPLLDAADLVTVMGNAKHPYAAGIKGQPGIEW